MPNWRLCDTLPMFKIVFTQSKTARLNDLVWTYAAWVDPVPHDVLGDANALMYVGDYDGGQELDDGLQRAQHQYRRVQEDHSLEHVQELS
ncbi:hypothetical protein LTR37_006351 [Vermiconidia calcicola]|uniref:Uncharacterized protein n=1 Tax=Vermiconidia calcicola TaxID=1690605 RepID=A0ACC3NGP7_9PEZI|nr:hypothetical protein LTR37_006351 [Vermiconidia calcicola]